MSICLACRVGRLAIAATLVVVLVVLAPASSPAIAQEAEDVIDLNGKWRFDGAVVNVIHDGNTVRAEFIEGAECLDGEVPPYFLDGELAGTQLTGTMMVCSGSARLVEECLDSSMYETTFTAAVEASRIAGTRVAQGIAVEEKDGRITSCPPDSRYDEPRLFALTRGCDPSLWDDYRRKEANALKIFGNSGALMSEGTALADAFVADFLGDTRTQTAEDAVTAVMVHQIKINYVAQLGKLVEDVQLLSDQQVRMLSPGVRSAGAVSIVSTVGTLYFLTEQLARATATTLRIRDTHTEAQEAFAQGADLLEAALRDLQQALDQLEDCRLEAERVREAEEFNDRAKALRDEWDLGNDRYRDAEGGLYDAGGALERAKAALQELESAETPAAVEEATRTAIEQIQAGAEAFGLGMDAFAEALENAADLADRIEELLESREQAEPIPVG